MPIGKLKIYKAQTKSNWLLISWLQYNKTKLWRISTKIICDYFILSNNHRVWNKGIGWKYTYGSINIWYGIVVLGGNFLKIREQVRRNNLIGWIFFAKLWFFFMKFSNLHPFNAPFWCILKVNMSEKLILERLCRIGLRFLAKSINMGYGIRACWE